MSQIENLQDGVVAGCTTSVGLRTLGYAEEQENKAGQSALELAHIVGQFLN